MPADSRLIKYSSHRIWSWSDNPSSTSPRIIACCAMTLRDLYAQLSVKLHGAKPRYMKHPSPPSTPQRPWHSPVRPSTMPLSWTEILTKTLEVLEID